MWHLTRHAQREHSVAPRGFTPRVHPTSRRGSETRAMSRDHLRELPEMLTPEFVAEWLIVSPSTLRRMAQRGDGPPFLQLSPRKRRYPRDAFASYIAARAATTT